MLISIKDTVRFREALFVALNWRGTQCPFTEGINDDKIMQWNRDNCTGRTQMLHKFTVTILITNSDTKEFILHDSNSAVSKTGKTDLC